MSFFNTTTITHTNPLWSSIPEKDENFKKELDNYLNQRLSRPIKEIGIGDFRVCRICKEYYLVKALKTNYKTGKVSVPYNCDSCMKVDRIFTRNKRCNS